MSELTEEIQALERRQSTSNPIGITMIQSKRFQDELDAAQFANKFIESVYASVKEKLKNFEIQNRNLAIRNHIVDGGVITLWADDQVIAIANIVRTNFNLSQVVCTDLTKDTI